MSLSVSNSVVRLLLLANVEAWRCRASNIEPVHFWIACLKMADTSFAGKLLDAGGTPEDCKEQAEQSNRLLAFLEMDSDMAAERRRTIRGKLLRGQPPREIPENGPEYLHRSESSRRLFEIAMRKAEARGSTTLLPSDIAESLFDMKLVSLE